MTAEYMEIVVELAKKNPEVRKAFDQDKRPERVLQRYKSIDPLFKAIKYYDQISKKHPEYTKKSRISGAVACAVINTTVSTGGKRLIVLGGTLIYTGILENAAAPVTAGASVLTGAGTVLLGSGSVALGDWSLKNADALALEIGMGYAAWEDYIERKGGYYKVITNSVLGFFSPKASGDGSFELMTNKGFVTATPAEQAAYRLAIERSLAENASLSSAEKFAILDKIDREQKASQDLKQRGVNLQVLASDPDLMKLITDPVAMNALLAEKVSKTPLENLATTPMPIQLKQDGRGFEYNWSLIDPKGTTAPWRSPIIQWMAENGGMLDSTGNFNLPLQDINKRPSQGTSRTSRHSTQRPKASEDTAKYLGTLLLMNAKELEDLDQIKTSLKVELSNGSKLTTGEALAILVDDYLARQAQAAQTQRYDLLKSSANLLVQAGQLIGCQSLVLFGQTSSIFIDMGFSIMRMSAGDWSASITFFSSIFSMVGLFKHDQQVNIHQIILDQLQTISQQIEALSEQIHLNHITLTEQLYALNRLIRKEFSTLSMQLQVNHIITTRRLDEIQQSLTQLSQQMHVQIQQLWFTDLLDTQFFIQNYKARMGDLSKLAYDDYHRIVEILVSWISQKSALSNSNGAHLYHRDASNNHRLAILQQTDPASILGFLIQTAINEFDLALPESLPVVNASAWLLAAHLYAELIEKCQPDHVIKRDPNLLECRTIFHTAKNILSLNKSLQVHQTFFRKLLTRYENTLLDFNNSLALLSTTIGMIQDNQHLDSIVSADRKILNKLKPISYTCDLDHLPANVKKNESKIVLQRARAWNQLVSHQLVQFNKQYQDDLWADIQSLEEEGFKPQLPMSMFSYFNENIVLPLSILFNDPNKVNIPAILLRAEKNAIGTITFDVTPNFSAQSIRHTVVVKFTHNKSTFDIATIYLNWHIANELIQSMTALANIEGAKYGNEWANKYLENAEQTTGNVKMILAWKHATIERVEYVNLLENQQYKAVCDALKKIEKQNFVAITQQISQGQATEIKSPQYQLLFDQLMSTLTAVELSIEYIDAFARVSALPQKVSQHLQQLLRRSDIVRYLMALANSSENNHEAFSQLVDYHLTGVIPKGKKKNWQPSVPVIKAGYMILQTSISDYMWEALTTQSLTIESFAVEQFLHVLHARAMTLSQWYLETYDTKLKIEDLDDFLPQKISAEIALPSQAYSEIQVEALLAVMPQKEQFVLLPTYYPFDEQPLDFRVELLESQIKEAFNKMIQSIQAKQNDAAKQPLTILLPICYENLTYISVQSKISSGGFWSRFSFQGKTNPVQQHHDAKLWSVLALEVRGENYDELYAYLINPVGIQSKKDTPRVTYDFERGDTSSKFSVPSAFTNDYKELNDYALPVMNYIIKQIPDNFKKVKSYFYSKPQLSLEAFRDSGVIVINNIEDWLANHDVTFATDITQKLLSQWRLHQLEILRKLDENQLFAIKQESETAGIDFTPKDIAYFTRIGLMSIPDNAHLVFAQAFYQNQPRVIESTYKKLNIKGSGSHGRVQITNFEGSTDTTFQNWYLTSTLLSEDVYPLTEDDPDILNRFESSGLLSIPLGMSLVYTLEPQWCIYNQERQVKAMATGSSQSAIAGQVTITFNCQSEKFSSVMFAPDGPKLTEDTTPDPSTQTYSKTKKEIMQKLKQIGFFRVPANAQIVVTNAIPETQRCLKKNQTQLNVTGSGNTPHIWNIGITAKGSTESFETLDLITPSAAL